LHIVILGRDTIAQFEPIDSIYDHLDVITIIAREKKLYKLLFHAHEARKYAIKLQLNFAK